MKIPTIFTLGPPNGQKNPTCGKWGSNRGGKWENSKAKGVFNEEDQLQRQM